jgi:hypothetical protein
MYLQIRLLHGCAKFKWPLKNLKESNVKDSRFMPIMDFYFCSRNITLENYEGKRLTPANLFVFIKLE